MQILYFNVSWIGISNCNLQGDKKVTMQFCLPTASSLLLNLSEKYKSPWSHDTRNEQTVKSARFLKGSNYLQVEIQLMLQCNEVHKDLLDVL